MRLLFKIRCDFKEYCQSVTYSPEESTDIQTANQGPSHPTVNAIFIDLHHRQFAKTWVTLPGIWNLKWALAQQQIKKLNGCQTRNGTQEIRNLVKTKCTRLSSLAEIKHPSYSSYQTESVQSTNIEICMLDILIVDDLICPFRVNAHWNPLKKKAPAESK